MHIEVEKIYNRIKNSESFIIPVNKEIKPIDNLQEFSNHLYKNIIDYKNVTEAIEILKLLDSKYRIVLNEDSIEYTSVS